MEKEEAVLVWNRKNGKFLYFPVHLAVNLKPLYKVKSVYRRGPYAGMKELREKLISSATGKLGNDS